MPVYALSVAVEHEYFAEGILVKNCDAALYLHRWCTPYLATEAAPVYAPGTPEALRAHESDMDDLAVAMMREVMALANAVGTKIDVDVEARVADSAKRASLPTSTLQDVRAGRPLEMDAIINVLIELGQMTGVPTPSLAVVAACVNLLNRRITDDGVAIRPVKRA